MGKAIAATLKPERGVRVFAVGRHTSEARTARELRASDYAILAVKPQDAPEAIQKFKNYFGKTTILVSILAGVPMKKLADMSGHKKVIRMMPNLGLSVGHGMAVWKSAGLTKQETARAKKFLNKITDNFEVKTEDTINRATAISGSGPAYFLLLAESLLAVARSLGFSDTESKKLVGKTFKAAAALSRDGDYAELIKKIASKKGTTEAALKVFRKKNFEKVVKDAAFQAYKRARELSK